MLGNFKKAIFRVLCLGLLGGGGGGEGGGEKGEGGCGGMAEPGGDYRVSFSR